MASAAALTTAGKSQARCPGLDDAWGLLGTILADLQADWRRASPDERTAFLAGYRAG